MFESLQVRTSDSPSGSSIATQIIVIILAISENSQENYNFPVADVLAACCFEPLREKHAASGAPFHLATLAITPALYLAGDTTCLLAENKTPTITWQQQTERNRMPGNHHLTTHWAIHLSVKRRHAGGLLTRGGQRDRKPQSHKHKQAYA